MTITKQPGVTYEVQSAGSLLPSLPDFFSPTTTTVLINDATTLKERDNTLIGNPAHALHAREGDGGSVTAPARQFSIA